MGKGSNRRQFNKKLEESYTCGHPKVFGEHEKVDGRRTRIVIQGNKLVKMNRNRDIFAIDPGAMPPTLYNEHRDWLLSKARGV